MEHARIRRELGAMILQLEQTYQQAQHDAYADFPNGNEAERTAVAELGLALDHLRSASWRVGRLLCLSLALDAKLGKSFAQPTEAELSDKDREVAADAAGRN